MSQQPFPYTTFTDPEGAALSNGYVVITLSQDAQSPNGLICGGMELRVQLNTSGVMSTVPQLWQNSDLNPSGTRYLYSAYTADGELVLGPEPVVM